MIDIESEVFTRVKTAVAAEIDDLYAASEYVSVVKHFPCLFLYESDNFANEETATTATNENHAQLTYTVECYSNKVGKKKAECKHIMEIVDKVMNGMGFVRLSMQPIQNQYDSTIYRIVARYRAVVSKDDIIYRR